MPADGSAVPTVVDTEPGRVTSLVFPVQGADLLAGVGNNGTYAIRDIPASGGTITTVVSSAQNSGTFIATANTVYYETWTGTTDTTNMVVTRSGTQSGIVDVNGTVIQAPVAGTTFVNGGEQEPWPNDTVTTTTPYETVFQVSGLSAVTVNSRPTAIHTPKMRSLEALSPLLIRLPTRSWPLSAFFRPAPPLH